MFNTGKTPFSIGKYRRLIDESNAGDPNITLEWECGLMVDGEFQSYGVDSRCFKDVAETETEAAVTDYTDLAAALPAMIGEGFVAAIESWLENKLAA